MWSLTLALELALALTLTLCGAVRCGAVPVRGGRLSEWEGDARREERW